MKKIQIKKLVLLPLFQTPKKYKNWAISKVYSNTIRNNSSLGDIYLNSNAVLKDAGNLKYNILGTSRHDRHRKKKGNKSFGDIENKRNIKKSSNSNKEILIINNENKNNCDLEIEKENYEPNLRKRKLSFSIREESSSFVESEKGDSFSEKMNIKNSIFNQNINRQYYNNDNEDDNLKNYKLSNIIFSSKKIDKGKYKNKTEYTKYTNNFSKIPINKPYSKSITYNNNYKNTSNNDNIIKEDRKNYRFVEIFGNSKSRKAALSIKNTKEKKIQNQSFDGNNFKESISEKSFKTSNYLYTKPILSINEFNSKKLNLSNSNININVSSSNNKKYINNQNNSNNKNSSNKKNLNNIKRLFTFMDNDNTNNEKDENNVLFNSNNNNPNKNVNQNNEKLFEKNNTNFEYDRKTNSLSNTNRNNTSIFNEDSFNNNYLWKFKTIEDDNYHNKKISGNTSTTMCSYNMDITNLNPLYPIYDWLKEINLICYYNLFIEKKIFNLDSIIYNLKNGLCNITKNDILKIGITLPGHIYRIITKMEIDSEKINNQISNLLLGKKNLSSDGEINILKNSIVYCCGCCSINNQSKYFCQNDLKKYQLEQWLSKIKMIRYKENFIKNGFDMIEYFILQMFSSIPIDENILKDELSINSINDRDFILLQINKDIKYIIQKTSSNRNKNIKRFKKSLKEEEKKDESSNCGIF